MPQNEMVYKEPIKFQELPAEVVRDLDGNHLEARSGEAIRLSTVSEDGWPHVAQLSVGEFLAVSPAELLVIIWPKSHTAENLRRGGRLTLSLVFNGALLEMRARATLKAEHQTKLDLAVFHMKIESVSEHRSTYADVTTGVTFKLHNREKTFTRWREQIAALKLLARQERA
jgi:uncharacterized protein YndB with AHSA1/START domain